MKLTIISNYIGQLSIAILSFIFIPVYIKYLGVEAYGLIGMFSVLQVALNIFDAGITPLISREMACFIAKERTLEKCRNLLRTEEILCITIGLIFSAILYFLSDILARNWLNVENLPIETVITSIRIAALVVMLRAQEDLYKGALIGLEKQIHLNVLNVLGALFRFFGIILVFKYYAANIETFYYWQLLSSVLLIFALAATTYKQIPGMLLKARFEIDEAIRNIKFSLGSITYAITAFINNQSDKIIVSKLFTLTEVGYYTLAVSLSGVLNMIATPIIQAFYPKIVILRSMKNDESAAQQHHLCCQLISLICGASAFSLIFYGKTLVGAWTNNIELTINVLPYLRILSISMLLFAITSPNANLPYISGTPFVNSQITSISIFLVFIVTLPLSLKFDAIGTAYGNLIQNLSILLATPLCFNCYLKSEQKQWFLYDVLKPVIIILVCFYLTSLFNLSLTPNLSGVLHTVLIAIIIILIAIYFTPSVWNLLTRGRNAK